MKKIGYIIGGMGFIALMLPKFVSAESPMMFDKWSVNIGTISAGCDVGFMCGSSLTGQGFLQRAIEDTSTGKRYFQTIITENEQTGQAGSTTLSFSDESFVGVGRGTYGLADKQHIIGSYLTSDLNNQDVFDVSFDAENVILTGWATSRGSSTDIEFDFNQVIALGFDANTEGKNQTFDMRQRIGDTGGGNMDMGLEVSFGLPIPFTSGDYIRATWFDQDIEGQSFGWMRYEEDPYTTATTTFQTFWSFTTITPFNYDPNGYDGLIDSPFDTTL